MSFHDPFPALRIGRTAQQRVAQGCAGRVLAVVTRAVYLVAEDGDLFWLAQDDVPMHNRAIAVSIDAGAFQPGMSFSAHAGTLRINVGANAVVVDWTHAARWVPPTIDPDRVTRPGAVLERVRQLRAQIPGVEMPDRAQPIIAALETACARNDLASIARSCRDLIGLGPGLTPSGDDYAGGLLFALFHLYAAYPSLGKWDRGLYQPLLEYASTLTPLISYTLLRDHAEGQGAEPLHGLLHALLEDDPTAAPPDLTPAHQLMHIGNTSGAEWLAGALAAMAILTQGGGDAETRRHGDAVTQ